LHRDGQSPAGPNETVTGGKAHPPKTKGLTRTGGLGKAHPPKAKDIPCRPRLSLRLLTQAQAASGWQAASPGPGHRDRDRKRPPPPPDGVPRRRRRRRRRNEEDPERDRATQVVEVSLSHTCGHTGRELCAREQHRWIRLPRKVHLDQCKKR